LTNASVDDFLILEYNNDIGGRVAHTNFGRKKDGSPYVVELGANWVQGTVSEGGPENPIWTFASFFLNLSQNVMLTFANNGYGVGKKISCSKHVSLIPFSAGQEEKAIQ
jgi:polyamine oxidase